MDTSRTAPPRRSLRVAADAATAATLLPRGAAALALAAAGRTGPAGSLLRAGTGTTRPGSVRVAAHAGATVLLGALSLVLTGVLLLTAVRGLFYGFVAGGPYDHAWGGPSLAGAWLTHFAVAVPCSLAALAALYGVARLHERLTEPLRGGRRPGWVVPVVLVCSAAGALFVVAFLRQLP